MEKAPGREMQDIHGLAAGPQPHTCPLPGERHSHPLRIVRHDAAPQRLEHADPPIALVCEPDIPRTVHRYPGDPEASTGGPGPVTLESWFASARNQFDLTISGVELPDLASCNLAPEVYAAR